MSEHYERALGFRDFAGTVQRHRIFSGCPNGVGRRRKLHLFQNAMQRHRVFGRLTAWFAGIDLANSENIRGLRLRCSFNFLSCMALLARCLIRRLIALSCHFHSHAGALRRCCLIRIAPHVLFCCYSCATPSQSVLQLHTPARVQWS